MAAAAAHVPGFESRDCKIPFSIEVEDKFHWFLRNSGFDKFKYLGTRFEGSSGRVYQVVLDPSRSSISLQNRYLQDRMCAIEGRDVSRIALKVLKPSKRRTRDMDSNKGSHYVMGNSHKNIASIYASIIYDPEDGNIYLEDELEGLRGNEIIIGYFQKWIEGDDLFVHSEKLFKEDSSMTAQNLRSIIRDIVSGLRHLKKRGVRHRDVTLANVLLNREGRAVLTDFDHSGRATTDDGVAFTAGTYGYMAPEVLFHYMHQDQSDYFSLGYLLAELVFKTNLLPNDRILDREVDLRCEELGITDSGDKSHVRREVWKDVYDVFLAKPYSDRIPIVRYDKKSRRMNSEYATVSDIFPSVSEDVQERTELFNLIKSMLLRTPELRRSGERVLEHAFMKRRVTR